MGSHRYNKTGIVGKINSWQFKAGDLSGLELAIRPDSLTRVKMGDTLIRMYSTVILAQILELSTQIQILQSQTTELSTGEKPQTVKEAQAKLDFAQEQVVIREKEYKIAKELLKEALSRLLNWHRRKTPITCQRLRLNGPPGRSRW